MCIQATEKFDEQPEEVKYAEIDKLLRSLKATGKNYDIGAIKKAYLFAKQMHEGQFRYSGEAYISHPIAVAEIVASLELDTDSICAALLHDTLDLYTQMYTKKRERERR